MRKIALILAIMVLGCSSIENHDLKNAVGEISAIDLNISKTGVIRVASASNWDALLVSMAYIGVDEVMDKVDIDSKSVSLIQNISMSSEWVHLFLIKDREVVSYSPIKMNVKISNPGFFVLNFPSSQIYYKVSPDEHFKVHLSQSSFNDESVRVK